MSPPPPAFVAEQAVGPQSVGSRLTLRSATTGEVVRGLGTFGQAFTNNGLAVTGNLAQVFYTLTPVRSSRHGNGLRVMRLDVASGRRSFIATGSEPALSPDDNQLAYGAYPNGLTVRDLETGRTRTVSLTRQLGAVANLTLTSITWLAGENEVAFVAPARAIATAGRAHGRPATGSCHAADGSTLVFVTVPPAPERLRAHCVTVPGLDSVEADLSASPTGSDVVRVGRWLHHPRRHHRRNHQAGAGADSGAAGRV